MFLLAVAITFPIYLEITFLLLGICEYHIGGSTQLLPTSLMPPWRTVKLGVHAWSSMPHSIQLTPPWFETYSVYFLVCWTLKLCWQTAAWQSLVTVAAFGSCSPHDPKLITTTPSRDANTSPAPYPSFKLLWLSFPCCCPASYKLFYYFLATKAITSFHCTWFVSL